MLRASLLDLPLQLESRSPPKPRRANDNGRMQTHPAICVFGILKSGQALEGEIGDVGEEIARELIRHNLDARLGALGELARGGK